MRAEYLLFNIFIFASSTLGIILYPRAITPKLRFVLYAIIPVITVFLLWDYLVTGYWWRFNDLFILGIKLGNLPIEEILFFITVPWSCLIIWVNLKSIFSERKILNLEQPLLIISVIIAIIAVLNQIWYTFAISLCVVVVSLVSKTLHSWLGRTSSLIYLGIILILTLIFNGYLTSRPVVIYDLSYATRFTIGTIPIEDMIYGLSMISLVTMLYEKKLLK